MKKTTYTTTRFDVNDDFYVEVSPNGEMIEFVLCMNNNARKLFMVGYKIEQCPEDLWEEIISDCVNEWIEEYEDSMEFLDEDEN